jgi:hypothetical protein
MLRIHGYLAAVSNLPLSRENCWEHTIAKIRFIKTPYTRLRNRRCYSSKLLTGLKTLAMSAPVVIVMAGLRAMVCPSVLLELGLQGVRPSLRP